MGEGYEVVTDALRAEGKRWQKFSDEASKVEQAMAGLSLEQSSFEALTAATIAGFAFSGMTSPTEGLATQYSRISHIFRTRVAAAAGEFDEIAKALAKVAHAYDQNEDHLKADLDLNKYI